DYVRDLRSSYSAMKSAAPTLAVIAGALGFSDTTWLEQAYTAGLKGNFDAISVHPYNVRFDSSIATASPIVGWPASSTMYSFGQGLPWIHWVMENHGEGDKPVWLTEFGFSNCVASSTLCVSDAQQGEWLAESFELA